MLPARVFCAMGDEWVVRPGWQSAAKQKLAAVIMRGRWELRDSAPVIIVRQQCQRCLYEILGKKSCCIFCEILRFIEECLVKGYRVMKGAGGV